MERWRQNESPTKVDNAWHETIPVLEVVSDPQWLISFRLSAHTPWFCITQMFPAQGPVDRKSSLLTARLAQKLARSLYYRNIYNALVQTSQLNKTHAFTQWSLNMTFFFFFFFLSLALCVYCIHPSPPVKLKYGLAFKKEPDTNQAHVCQTNRRPMDLVNSLLCRVNSSIPLLHLIYNHFNLTFCRSNHRDTAQSYFVLMLL